MHHPVTTGSFKHITPNRNTYQSDRHLRAAERRNPVLGVFSSEPYRLGCHGRDRHPVHCAAHVLDGLLRWEASRPQRASRREPAGLKVYPPEQHRRHCAPVGEILGTHRRRIASVARYLVEIAR